MYNFTFDRVFGSGAQQADVFTDIAQVGSCLKHYLNIA